MKRYHVVCEHCGETFIEDTETRVLRVLERHRSRDHPFLATPGPPTSHLRCDRSGCQSAVKDHRWGRIHAANAGWFFQKDGSSWCPEHVPDWVAEWREHQRSKKKATT